MKFTEKLRNEFSFFPGNYLILILSWVFIDFAQELPGTYFSDYVLQLGGSPTILGVIAAVSMLTLAIPSLLISIYGIHELKPEEKED